MRIHRHLGMACLTLQPEEPAAWSLGLGQLRERTSRRGGLVVAHSDSILVAHPGSLKACPESLLSGKAGQVLELTRGVRWGPLSCHWPRALGTAFRPVFSVEGW